MGVIGGNLGYRMLRAISPNQPKSMSGGSYTSRSKTEVLLGEQVWNEIQGRTVIDFGCGAGSQAIELAQRGARHVYGIDIQERWLAIAREQAQNVGCRNVTFSHGPAGPADVIISIDSFEHFADPAAILKTMAGMLRPNGCVLVSFGPPWYHPLGGHLFSVFPWAHLIFTEQALCRWRSHIRNDGARKFREVEGGLNQMTIKGFERLVQESPFQIERLEAIPIRATRMFHNRLTREFLTAVIRCKLSLKGTARPLSA
jgi:ubiquinone/menaquinone biosynthesis C-methylase UbiE